MYFRLNCLKILLAIGYLFQNTVYSLIEWREFISVGSEARIFSGEIFTAGLPYLYRFGTRSCEI